MNKNVNLAFDYLQKSLLIYENIMFTKITSKLNLFKITNFHYSKIIISFQAIVTSINTLPTKPFI